MDFSCGQNAAHVMLAFLQADCRNLKFRQELSVLDQEINCSRDINCNGLLQDDGAIETDSGYKTAPLLGMQPSLELPGNRADEAAFQRVAEELRVIADQFQQNVVAQATRSLHSNISRSPFEEWRNLLSGEVNRVMRQTVSLKDLQREQVIMALTFTLVKGVCEQTPELLRTLFHTALQYINFGRTR